MDVVSRAKAIVAIPAEKARAAGRLRRRRLLRIRTLLVLLLVGVGLVFALRYEGDSSRLQSLVFSRLVSEMTYEVRPGPASMRAYAPGGPSDVRRGYSLLPDFEARLTESGMRVSEQAVASDELHRFTRWGITPPYGERQTAMLKILSSAGDPLYTGHSDSQVFASFEEIPPLLVDSLLFIENKQLLNPHYPTQNPTLEWKRLGKAVLSYLGEKLGIGDRLEGGSTLATQLEKFRHSPSGRTSSGREKIRQLVSASLKSYWHGPDTTLRRREIVVEYLNSIPLAAVPRYGEIYGLGAGLDGWFGMSLDEVTAAMAEPGETPARVRAYKHALALIAALQAPFTYLTVDHAALERRIAAYLDLLTRKGVLTPSFAAAVAHQPLEFRTDLPQLPVPDFRDRKAVNAVRSRLKKVLSIANFYDLDRLDLTVESTFDADLQRAASDLMGDLADPNFVREHGLNGQRLLGGGDPSKVLYSLLLFERTPEGNAVRLQIDNLNKPLDLNRGIKLELGSTAKLRTTAHYLEIISLLYREMAELKPEALARVEREANDPLTRWTAARLRLHPDSDLYSVLDEAMQRTYSGSPGEAFFTGGGLHHFNNFDHRDDGASLPLIEAFRRSTNLVFVRLMRDLVAYHRARLPYDAEAVLGQEDHPVRRQMLDDIATAESRTALRRAYERYQGLSPDQLVDKLLGSQKTARRLTVLFFAWKQGASEAELSQWLRRHLPDPPAADVARLKKAYDNPQLTISDYGFLLGRHPLEVWTAGELLRQPGLTREQLYAQSGSVREIASSWLYKTRNRRAQDRRLRIRIEQDAFARMTPYWQRLGFPFARLVPSYATALGNSSDRPAALADLMGIIINNGWKRPTGMLRELRFAEATPYETAFRTDNPEGEMVMEMAVARTLQQALSEVARNGTARVIWGAFQRPDGTPVIVGGKTGTGDNRFRTFARGGTQKSSRVLNRTATFVFFIEDRYYGVLTAFVPGEDAARFSYTSSLAVHVLKLLAPAINQRLAQPTVG